MAVEDGGKLLGTLTSWQQIAAGLVASGVGMREEDEEPELRSASSFTVTASRANSRGFPQAGRSFSLCSCRSEDSSMSMPVVPKQHHLLYKEYRLSREIGAGAFGRVCLARRLTDGKDVVVKEVKTTSLSDKLRAATMEEVLVLANLSHPNVVKYHDCFMDDHWVFIVLEYCNAGDLSGLIKHRAGQPIPEEEVMFLFVQLCLALQYTHAAGVLHRDLKTSNVLLMNVQQQQQQSGANAAMQAYAGLPLLKLGDFGVSKITGVEGSLANSVVGTPQYLCPEMMNNQPYGRKSDVWALGCVLYELCCLRKAFEGPNLPAIIMQIQQGCYSPLPDCYSPQLKELVQKTLTRDPAQRPQVSDILGLPFVRLHLCLYLEWARHVPEAHPETVLASLGDSWLTGQGAITAAAGASAGFLAGLAGSSTAAGPGLFRSSLKSVLSSSNSLGALGGSPKTSPRCTSFYDPPAQPGAAAGRPSRIVSAFAAAAAASSLSRSSSQSSQHSQPLPQLQLQLPHQLQDQQAPESLWLQGVQRTGSGRAPSGLRSSRESILSSVSPTRLNSAAPSGRATADSVSVQPPLRSLSGWLSGDMSLAQGMTAAQQVLQEQQQQQLTPPMSPSRLSISVGVDFPSPSADWRSHLLLALQQQQQPQQDANPAAAAAAAAAASITAAAQKRCEAGVVAVKPALQGPTAVAVYVAAAAGSQPNSPVYVARQLSGHSGSASSTAASKQAPEEPDAQTEQQPDDVGYSSSSGDSGGTPAMQDGSRAASAAAAAQRLAAVVGEQQELQRKLTAFRARMLPFRDVDISSNSSSSVSKASGTSGGWSSSTRAVVELQQVDGLAQLPAAYYCTTTNWEAIDDTSDSYFI